LKTQTMRVVVSLGLVASSAYGGSYMLPVRSAQWPKPNTGYFDVSTDFLCVNGEFTLDESSKVPEDCSAGAITVALEDLTNQYGKSDPKACTAGSSLQTSVIIEYSDCVGAIRPGIDESYKLTVTAGKPTVTAANEYGIRHGLTTLGNLIESRYIPFVDDAKKMNPEFKYFVDPTKPSDNYWVFPYTSDITIEDEPRLPHRGLMIDSARTYIPVDSIKNTIKAMGMVKMSVLHWHLTDDQSFPALFDSNPDLMHAIHGEECSPETPLMCLGLFSPDSFYTDDDLKSLVDLAESYGVRVVFEIDQPAHAVSWCSARRDLLFWRGQNTREAFYETWGVLNIFEEFETIWNTFGQPILDHVMDNISRKLEDIHFGADEFPPGVFGEGNHEDDYVEPWLEKVITHIESKLRTAVAWQDGLKSKAGQDHAGVVAQIWDNAAAAIEIANTGHNILWSPATVMYLDCGRGNTVIPDLGSWCQPYSTWYEVYIQTPDLLIEEDPGYNKSDSSGIVIGGEVALWNDARNREEQETGLWPRAASWAGATWEARDSIPISAMNAKDEATLNAGIAHSVEAQRKLGQITRRIQIFTDLQVASFFQDYCLYKGGDLCDSYIGVWYTENYEANQGVTTEEPTDDPTGPTTCPEVPDCPNAAASLVGTAGLAAMIVALTLI
jgi:hexosaminidase